MQKTDYSKLRTKILGIIEGLTMTDSKYFDLRKVLIYAEGIHHYTRRDGSPEFSHQLEMLSLALSLHNSLIKPFEVYMAIIVHDTIEDYPEKSEELHSMFPDIAQYSRKLSKFVDSDNNEDEKTYYRYFDNISKCEVCSVVKLIDRIHNLSTAPGVFSNTKISEYCDEVDTYFLCMMHIAKSNFNQREVYEVLKFILQNEVRTIRTFLRITTNIEQQKTISASELVNRLKGSSSK